MAETRVELRVSAEQKAQIAERAAAAGLTLSDFIRSAALGDSTAPPASIVHGDGPVAEHHGDDTAAPSSKPEPSPPAPDDDLQHEIAARAKVLERRMGKRTAWAQARRELA